MGAGLADDDGRVLCDDEAAHVDVGGGRRRGRRAGRGRWLAGVGGVGHRVGRGGGGSFVVVVLALGEVVVGDVGRRGGCIVDVKVFGIGHGYVIGQDGSGRGPGREGSWRWLRVCCCRRWLSFGRDVIGVEAGARVGPLVLLLFVLAVRGRAGAFPVRVVFCHRVVDLYDDINWRLF